MCVCLVYYVMFMFFSLFMFVMGLFFLMWDYSLLLEYEMLYINSCSIMMTILFDWMSLLFMSFVLFISSMVVLYSKEYMNGDLYLNRFIMLVSMFVLSMMLLIISPNMISILLGWDGLGLVSYCLVIYYQNIKSYNAGMITALTNRLGDVALLMAIAWMVNYGSFNYIFCINIFKNDLEMYYICMLVMLAALTKSAQIPFSSWLPAAMAAPTPVSALVHSSTLVTAGVYLLIRFSGGLFVNIMWFLLFIGIMTMFMAGLGANFEFDLKKIIALSTLSQLGLMMSILAMGEYKLAFFHLLTHALFKALLFMCAGCMIHNLNNCQDIRYMGGMINYIPLTIMFFVISNLSLCGLPFLSGFYSKDLILEFLSMNYLNIYVYLMFFISVGLTVNYTFRMLYYVVMGDFNYFSMNMISDFGMLMLKGMGGLIMLVIMAGSMLMWLIFDSLFMICLSMPMKIMTLLVIFVGVFLGTEVSKFALNYDLKSYNLLDFSLFFSCMWNMPYISTFGVNYYPIQFGNKFIVLMEYGWSEYLGSQNIYFNMSRMSLFFQMLYYNNLKIFMLLLILWVIFMMLYL